MHTAVGCCSSSEELVRDSEKAGQTLLLLLGCSAGELAAETCQEDVLCRVSVLVTEGALGLDPGAGEVAARELLSLFI